VRKLRVFRDDHVHVMAERCQTCIFRPGNLMSLRRGRVRQMVDDATRLNSCIVCHDTSDTKEPAVCRGFFELHPTAALRIAELLGRIRFQKP